jgi:hypothetical protein
MRRRARPEQERLQEQPGPGYSTAEVVAEIYHGVLGREPDPAGLAFLTARLDEGNAPSAAIRGLLQSEEFQQALLRSAVLPGLREALWAEAQAVPRKTPPVYFLHIMRTGGTALGAGLRDLLGHRRCLSDIFIDHLVALPSYVFEHASLIAGHLSYEAVEVLPPGFAVLTVLRDPVERTLSHYAKVRQDPEVLAENPGLSLEEFLDSPRWRTLTENYQARHLVHRIGLVGAWRDFSPQDRYRELGPLFPPVHSLPLQSVFDSTPLSVPADRLEAAALSRLDGIEFVGVTEELDGAFAKVAAAWGVDDPPRLPRLHAFDARAKAGDVAPSVLDAIVEANQVDLALYEAARKRAPTG